MKKQQKTETLQNTTESSPFLDKNMVSANKKMKNKANFNNVKLTVTSCSKAAYNDLRPKIKNGTNPNKANFQNGRSTIFQNIKIMKNEANFNSVKLTVNSYSTVGYNALQPKIQNGTKPNEPNQSQFEDGVPNLKFA